MVFFVEILFPLEFTFFLVRSVFVINISLFTSSSATVMDIGETMENARYAMNDDTAGFINQKKNRNTSTKLSMI